MSTDPSNAYRTAPVDYLTRITALFGDYKRRALEFMELRPGEHLLDAGCGTGDDLLMIGQAMGGAAKLTGVDLDEGTLKAGAARAEKAGIAIDFRQGDLVALPLEDDSVDVARSDRVFQHLPDPVASLGEMIRVTRPGGRVVGVDVDWGTLVLDHPQADFSDRIAAFARDQHTNGRSGRMLRRWFREAGLDDVEGYADVVCVTDWEIATYIWTLRDILDRMVRAEEATAAEADDWWAAAESHAQAGYFCGSMTGFVFKGTVPDRG